MNPLPIPLRRFSFVILPAIIFTSFAAPQARAGAAMCIETNGVKFILPPLLDGGWDVKTSRGIVVADDFYCNRRGPITDIHIWGSWLGDFHGQVTNFWIGIYDDVPAVTNVLNNSVTPSHPGTNLLWQQWFGPGEFSESLYGVGNEAFFDPLSHNFIGGDTVCWYYCFYPTDPFIQRGSPNLPTNYWLSVYAEISDTTNLFGWKTSQNQYNDRAVWCRFLPGANIPSGDWLTMTNIEFPQPINLAFKLTTPTNPPPPEGCVETNGTKYVQRPNLDGGLDVWNDGPWVLADDFVCTNTGPITDIHLWGSWMEDKMDTNLLFWLAIYDDVPVNATNNYSHPGGLLWQEEFKPGEYLQSFWGTGIEQFLDPGPPAVMGPDSEVWYYCFYPKNQFVQEGDPTTEKIYWLVVYVKDIGPAPLNYGWKTTTTVRNDISVHTQWTGGPPTNNAPWLMTTKGPDGGPLDLAFKITTATNPPPPPPQCVETDGVKYVQWPNVLGGMDVWDNPYVLADDFICTNSGPITDIHLWGSWYNNQALTNMIRFWLAMYEDVPINPTNNFSHPGKMIWQQWFGPGEYAETFWGEGQEIFLDPGPPEPLGPESQIWYYCFNPTNPPIQTGSTSDPKIYWIAAHVEVPAGAGFRSGWKTTTNVQFDVSVHATWPGTPPVGNPGWTPTISPAGGPLDLAFKLTTPTNHCFFSVLCASNKMVECGDPWKFDPPVIITNVCCPNPPTITFNAVTNGTAPCKEIIVGTWVITDCDGTTLTCSQTVIVEDTTPPEIVCGPDKTVECGDPWSFDKPFASDACCGTNVTVSVLGTVTNSTGCSRAVTRTWLAEDCCTNRSTCSQTVTIVDTTPPVLTCTTNKIVPFGMPWKFDPPTATDQCCTNVGVFVVSTTTNGIGCNQVVTRVWRAIDCCENLSAPCTQVVTFECCSDTNALKYAQWPNTNLGYDVWNSSTKPPGAADGPWLLADDFVCTNTGFITDIHLWGSWWDDIVATNRITFWLALFEDVPTNSDNVFSHPGKLIWSECFAPGQYSESPWSRATEQFLDPGPPSVLGPDSTVWYYCFYPTKPPLQRGLPYRPKTYWLGVYAELPADFQAYYGWKTTIGVRHDISVHAPWQFGSCPTKLPDAIPWTPTRDHQDVPLDLAFQLTTATNCASTFINIDYPSTNIVVLTWPKGILQAATNVLGPYLDVPGAMSPYTNTTLPFPPTNRFYRVRCP